MIDDFLFWFFDGFFKILLLVVAGAIIFGIPYGIYFYAKYTPPEKFELATKDWECTKVHEYTTTSMIMAGKVMVPQIHHHKDCVQWSHR